MGLFGKNKNNQPQDHDDSSAWTKDIAEDFSKTLNEETRQDVDTELHGESELTEDDSLLTPANLKSKKGNFTDVLKKVKGNKASGWQEDFTDDTEPGIDLSEGLELTQEHDDFTRASLSEHEDSIFVSKNLSSLNEKSSHSDLLSENSFDNGPKKLPVIGNWSVRRQYQLGVGIAALGLVGLISGIFTYNSANTKENQAIQATTELNGSLQKLENYYASTMAGRTGAYDNLLRTSTEVKKDFAKVKAYNNDFSGSSDVNAIQSQIDMQMGLINKNITVLGNQGDFLRAGSQTVQKVSDNVAQLNALVDKLSSSYSQTNATPAEIYNIYGLKGSLQSINNKVTNLLLADDASSDLLKGIDSDRNTFKTALSQFYNGDSAKGVAAVTASQQNAYSDLTTGWIHFSSLLNSVVEHGTDLVQLRANAAKTMASMDNLSQNIQTLQGMYGSNDLASLSFARMLLLLSIVILVVATVIIFYIYNFERDNRSNLEKSEYSRNQSSILKLLNEMMPLQDGDLTQKTTVTEEITGAIADSINATIDSLASLVKKIKDTSLVMREKTNEVNNISISMLATNEKQTEELTHTGQSVIDISKAINDISQKTETGAEVATNSVKVSQEGAQQVLASVQAMQEINDNMSETVHLMKKVSDSSKQISEIVELLSDISEETAILALNATVQAAKAGESGKGFKIVADGIQELADSAGEATRRVGALIAAVQTDIQAVGEAVQKTTNEVERGVNLSELAGASLNQINEVSNNLASIVSSISDDAKKHAQVADDVSFKMQKILQVTEETRDATQKTASSIGEIAETANELGESVQSFKVE